MNILGGFVTVFSDPMVLFCVLAGAVLGIIIGAIPGLTTAAGIAMLIPLTYKMDPLAALVLLYVIGKAGRVGGTIPAILFNTPGTVSAAAATLDGYPLAVQGMSVKAIRMSMVAAAFGDTCGELLLIFGAAYIASITTTLGPPDYFAAYFMAFLVIGSVIAGSIIKGLLSALLGVLFAIVGLDPISATPRYDFGFLELESGLHLVPVLVGVFVLAEILIQAESHHTLTATEIKKSNQKSDNNLSWQELKMVFPVMLRSTAIGAAIGMLPGIGSAVSVFVAYGNEKRIAKRKELWGKGAIEGIAAPEAASNAVSGPSMIPLLALGIPGSTIAAILVGIFVIHGIKVGPLIFKETPDLIYGLFASGLLGIATYALFGYYLGPQLGRLIAAFPSRLIYPFIFLTSFIAAYSISFSTFDVAVMGVFGLIGYFMRKNEFNTPAFVIAFVLTGGAEEALRQSFLLSDRGILLFLDHSFAIVCFLIGFGVVLFRVISNFLSRRNSARGVKRQYES